MYSRIRGKLAGHLLDFLLAQEQSGQERDLRTSSGLMAITLAPLKIGATATGGRGPDRGIREPKLASGLKQATRGWTSSSLQRAVRLEPKAPLPAAQ